jgi:Sulfatase-modifying factor enzyme 1/TIR domain
MPRIFISYRREDSIAYAGRIYDRLSTQFGAANVFMDIDTLEPGIDFVEVLQQTVASCDILLAVVGTQWLAAKDEEGRPRLSNPEDFVALEIGAALKRNIRVVPILVGGARMPRSAELPEPLSNFSRRHALVLPDMGFHQTLGRLIQSIERAGQELPARERVRINPKDGLPYVWIPPGSFMMGCSPGDTECYDDEKPAHAEQIANGFWLSQTVVTQAAWKKVMNNNPSHFKGDQLPVECVDWSQASDYCKAIGGRLPTEKEWEYAARAGSTGARYGAPDAIAWYSDNSGETTHPVGLKQANAFGLYDMLGNVWEWTADNYDPSGEYKVVRGGSWYVDTRYVRASYRVWSEPTLRYDYLGFRCVGEFR